MCAWQGDKGFSCDRRAHIGESGSHIAFGDMRSVSFGRWSLNGTTNVEAGWSRRGGMEMTVMAIEWAVRELLLENRFADKGVRVRIDA